ncbi:hypothetical protein ACOZDE_18635 [Streptomyces griseoincarnatus]
MLAAAEAQIDAAAEDDQERARNRARLYAPPAEGARRRRGPRAADAPRPKPTAGGMTLEGARALMSQLAAQDAQLTGGRSG